MDKQVNQNFTRQKKLLYQRHTFTSKKNSGLGMAWVYIQTHSQKKHKSWAYPKPKKFRFGVWLKNRIIQVLWGKGLVVNKINFLGNLGMIFGYIPKPIPKTQTKMFLGVNI